MTIYQRAEQIADLLREALKSDSMAPTVLSATLGDILRDDLEWTSAEETSEICDDRDSAHATIESLRDDMSDLKDTMQDILREIADSDDLDEAVKIAERGLL